MSYHRPLIAYDLELAKICLSLELFMNINFFIITKTHLGILITECIADEEATARVITYMLCTELVQI
jgi:hypothetical protein